jgi:hypothetical protein
LPPLPSCQPCTSRSRTGAGSLERTGDFVRKRMDEEMLRQLRFDQQFCRGCNSSPNDYSAAMFRTFRGRRTSYRRPEVSTRDRCPSPSCRRRSASTSLLIATTRRHGWRACTHHVAVPSPTGHSLGPLVSFIMALVSLAERRRAASLYVAERQTPPRVDRPADQQDNLVIKVVPALHKHCRAADLGG